jgi:hypothetical protein
VSTIFNGADSHYKKFDRYNHEAQYFTIFVKYSHKSELMKTITGIRRQRLKERDNIVLSHDLM